MDDGDCKRFLRDVYAFIDNRPRGKLNAVIQDVLEDRALYKERMEKYKKERHLHRDYEKETEKELLVVQAEYTKLHADHQRLSQKIVQQQHQQQQAAAAAHHHPMAQRYPQRHPGAAGRGWAPGGHLRDILVLRQTGDWSAMVRTVYNYLDTSHRMKMGSEICSVLQERSFYHERTLWYKKDGLAVRDTLRKLKREHKALVEKAELLQYDDLNDDFQELLRSSRDMCDEIDELKEKVAELQEGVTPQPRVPRCCHRRRIRTPTTPAKEGTTHHQFIVQGCLSACHSLFCVPPADLDSSRRGHIGSDICDVLEERSFYHERTLPYKQSGIRVRDTHRKLKREHKALVEKAELLQVERTLWYKKDGLAVRDTLRKLKREHKALVEKAELLQFDKDTLQQKYDDLNDDFQELLRSSRDMCDEIDELKEKVAELQPIVPHSVAGGSDGGSWRHQGGRRRPMERSSLPTFYIRPIDISPALTRLFEDSPILAHTVKTDECLLSLPLDEERGWGVSVYPLLNKGMFGGMSLQRGMGGGKRGAQQRRYYLFHWEHPFGEETSNEQLLTIDQSVDERAASLMRGLLAPDPADRFQSAAEALQHPYFMEDSTGEPAAGEFQQELDEAQRVIAAYTLYPLVSVFSSRASCGLHSR
ncbi:unnamed protein product [Vitrella brassicaformis CCMP3155]|uniref:Protein kinase domain-containing protein n=1 Tax=Vitrella brassicaformis (strain CCMP3155) TaxID=1169540 RepID=A0A0G4FAY5_VITBC|nr:unnamed protein product [Vitrella brassicaformis CCMP3155]|eukprot:CEM09785.1 unnamed protein product [Vitrella brassicaformis CCMP3155]